MDKILGETFTVQLGGKDYTLSPIKLKILSRAMSYFKRKKVTEFIEMAKETDLPAEIFAGELRALYEERDTIGLEDFLAKHDGDSDFTLYCLFLGLRDYDQDLKKEQFEDFPDSDVEAALVEFLGDAVSQAKEEVKKKKPKKKKE